MTTHAGRILIHEEILLKWLQYDGGRIHYIGFSEDYLAITVTIEHPDMPKVKKGEVLPMVTPVYWWDDFYRAKPRIGLGTRLL